MNTNECPNCGNSKQPWFKLCYDCSLKENILELNSIYLSNLANFDLNKIKIPEEVREIREIMSDWTGED